MKKGGGGGGDLQEWLFTQKEKNLCFLTKLDPLRHPRNQTQFLDAAFRNIRTNEDEASQAD